MYIINNNNNNNHFNSINNKISFTDYFINTLIT